MTMRRLLATALLLLAPALGAQSSTATTRDVEEVKATLVRMWDAVEAGDVERYATFVHEKFTSFGENDTYLGEGKANEVRSYRDYLARVKNVHTVMHQAEVTVRGTVAWITYYWTDDGVSLADGKRFTSRGKSTRIFVKEDGKWLCIHGHYTAVP